MWAKGRAADSGRHFAMSALRKLVEDENSCVSCITCRRSASIMPIHLADLKSSIKELLSDKTSIFDIELQGVVLAHKNIKIIPSSIQLDDNRSFPLEYVADLYVFKPAIGSTLSGVINQIAKDYVSVLVHNMFNVTVYPSGARPQVRIGSPVVVQVNYIDFTGRLPFITAKFLVTDCSSSVVGSTRKTFEDEEEVNDELSQTAQPVQSILKLPSSPQVVPERRKKRKRDSAAAESGSPERRKGCGDEPLELAAVASETVENGSPKRRKRRKNEPVEPTLDRTAPLGADESIFGAASSTPNAATQLTNNSSPHKKKKKSKTHKIEDLSPPPVKVEPDSPPAAVKSPKKGKKRKSEKLDLSLDDLVNAQKKLIKLEN